MENTKLFDSLTDPIPQVRRDLQVVPVEQDGNSYLLFRDARGYAPSDFGLQRQIESLLSLLDGSRSVRDLQSHLSDGADAENLLEFIQMLDKNRLLNSNYFKDYVWKTERKYEEETLHQSVTAGKSYPDDPEELRNQLNEAFANVDPYSDKTQTPKALYAPHVDPRVGLDTYAEAFSKIRDLEPQRVVVLATSHYAGLYPETYLDTPFILVNKDFETPLATIKRDEKAIQRLSGMDNKSQMGLSISDRAHRMEHSIELHTLFLSYMWQHDFEIIPFLVGGFQDLYYEKDGQVAQQLDKFSAMLNDEFGSDDDTFFLISGDLAHFGTKFGDQYPANTMFEEVKDFDEQFIQHGTTAQPQSMLELMRESKDPYRICGFPPLYTFLNAFSELEGRHINYDLWDQQERDSAVTFGSILFQ